MSDQKHCHDYGFPGTRVDLFIPLPKGKVCTLTGFAQTAAQTITVEVLDGKDKVKATITKDDRTPSPIILTDRGTAPFFTVEDDTHYLRVSSSEGQTPQVLLQPFGIPWAGKNYAGGYAIAVEDHPEHGDCDFNDCVGFLTWTLEAN
jgi:hypothetical protein